MTTGGFVLSIIGIIILVIILGNYALEQGFRVEKNNLKKNLEKFDKKYENRN